MAKFIEMIGDTEAQNHQKNLLGRLMQDNRTQFSLGLHILCQCIILQTKSITMETASTIKTKDCSLSKRFRSCIYGKYRQRIYTWTSYIASKT